MSLLIRYNDTNGWRTALLVDEGRKYLHILQLDNPLQMRRVPLSEARYMRVLPNPIGPALKTFRRCARAWHGALSTLSHATQEAIRHA